MKYSIPAPYAIDSFNGDRVEGDNHYTENIDVSLILQTDGTWLYSMMVDENFLFSGNTIYPIKIDPTVVDINTCSEHKDTYAAKGTSGTNYYNGDKMFVGRDSTLLECRGFVNFDLTKLWNYDEYSINSAIYYTEEFLGYTSTCYVRIYRVGAAWTSPTLTWSNQPEIDTTTIIDSKLVNGAGDYSFDITDLVEGWVLNKHGVSESFAQNGFVMMSDRESSIVLRKFRSSEASTNPPNLVINFNLVDRTAPNPPTGLTTTYIKNTSNNGKAQLKVSWTAATDLPSVGGSGIKNYEVAVKNSSGTTLKTYTGIVGTTYQTTDYFDDNTTYTMCVLAVDNAKEVDGTAINNKSGYATASLAVLDCEIPVISSLTVTPSSWTNASSVALGWTVVEPSGLSKIEYYFTSPTTTISSPALTGTTSINVSGLDSGTYLLTVKFTDNQNNVTTTTRSVYIDRTSPLTPTNLASTGITSSSVSLSWSAPTDNVGVTGYKIYKDGVFAADVTGTVGTISGLTDGTLYTFTVKAKDAAGNLSPSSSAIQVRTVDISSPSTPTNLTCTSKTGTTVSLSWTASTDNVGVTGYHIYCNGVDKGTSTTTSYTVTGLTNGTTYTFTVKAYDAASNLSAASSGLNVQTDDTQAPNAPTNLALTGKTGTTVSLSWTAPSDNVGVTGYRIYCDGVEKGTSATTSYTVTGLSNGTNYTFTVKAYDAASNLSAASSGLNVQTIDTSAPSIPGNVSSSSVTDSSVTLTWSTSTDNVAVTGYSVFCDGNLVGSTTNTSYTISDLDDATTYNFTVKAYDAAGNTSGASSAYQATTIDITAPAQPASLSFTSKTGTSVALSWTSSTDNLSVAGYRIYNGTALLGTTTGSTYTASNLIQGTQYNFMVIAYDAANNQSDASVFLKVTTLQRPSGILPLHQSVGFDVVGGSAFADIQTGNLNYLVDDYKLPEWQFDLSISRNYNSRITTGTLLGQGWDLSLNLYLIEEFASTGDTIPSTVTFRDHTGTYWSFTVQKENGSVTNYLAPFGCPYSLYNIDNQYEMTDESGILYKFNSNKQLQTVLAQPSLFEVSVGEAEQNHLSEVYLSDHTGDMSWTFTAIYDSYGELESFARELDCPFELSLNEDGEYVLTEDQNTNMVYYFTPNSTENIDQFLIMLTEIQSSTAITEPASLTFNYDTSNRIIGLCDDNGHAISVAYGSGNIQVTDLEGRKVIYSITNNQLNSVQRYNGLDSSNHDTYATTLYTYDTNGYLTSISDPDSVVNRLTFDSNGRITSHADLYSTLSDAQQTVTAWWKYTLIEYDSNVTTVRNRMHQLQRTSSASLDTLLQDVMLGKRIYTISLPENRISFIASFPQPILFTGDGSDEYDYFYNVTPITVISFTYEDSNIDGYIDTINRTTTDCTSTANSRSEEIALSSGNTAFYAMIESDSTVSDENIYDLAGRIIARCTNDETHDSANHKYDEFEYSLAGRTTNELTYIGLETNYTYDSSGRVCKTVHPDGHESTKSYDFISILESPFTEDYFLELEADYGLNYFLERHVNTYGQTVYEEISNCGEFLSLINSYNGFGETVSQTDKNNNITSYQYNDNGQVLFETVNLNSVDDNLVTSYTYDDFDLILSKTDPYGNTITYEYDYNNGNRLDFKSTVVNGKLTREAYNYSTLESGHYYTLTTTSYDGPTTSAADITTTVSQVSESGLTNNVSKDVSDLYNSETTIQNDYSYDENSQLEQIGHNGFYYVFNRDEDGSIISISVECGEDSIVLLEKEHSDNPDGSTTDTDSFANGQDVSVITDNLGRLEKIQYTDGTSSTDRYIYSYLDNDTTIVDNSSGRKTESSKSGDNLGFYQEIVVTDLNTIVQLYSFVIANSKEAVTLTTQIGSTHQSYTYNKDSSGRLFQTAYKLIDNIPVLKNDSYGDFGELTGSVLNIGVTAILQKNIGYRSISEIKYSGQVESETIQQGSSTVSYGYVYDGLGNITKITKTVSGTTTDLFRYEYDEASQLVREDNTITNQTTVWVYDVGGNIRTRNVYALTAENTDPTTLIDSVDYTYSTGIWKDQLASYDGQSITYDESGNPTSYMGATMTWTMGRQLASYDKTGLSIDYTYNQDGIRTSKTVNNVRTDYYLSGNQVIAEVTGGNRIDYRYDGNGQLIALRYNSNEYYTVTNIQGDIIGLIDGSGNSVVQYTYDAWGNQTSCTGTLANTLGQANPYRYRGYRVDTETGLYYLQSRYYDANVGRFVNEDMFEVLSLINFNHNLYSYCYNNSISLIDKGGNIAFENGLEDKFYPHKAWLYYQITNCYYYINKYKYVIRSGSCQRLILGNDLYLTFVSRQSTSGNISLFYKTTYVFRILTYAEWMKWIKQYEELENAVSGNTFWDQLSESIGNISTYDIVQTGAFC